MKIAVLGRDGPVARATRARVVREGHACASDGAECAIYFPGSMAELESIVVGRQTARLVLRSHAFAYGSSPKNPGMMTEERVSLLPEKAPERVWLELEAAAARHSSFAAVRLASVLSEEENDPVVRQLARTTGVALAGRDPNLQFLSVEDAASALVAAATSKARGIFNVAAPGSIPLKAAFRAAGTRRVPLPKQLARFLGDGGLSRQIEYNWTVSTQRAFRELGWEASQSTTESLAEFALRKRGARPDILEKPFDDWGLDVNYIRAWSAWFWFLRKVYWRIECEGMEEIPQTGRALFVSNHRGFMPLDAVMHVSLIQAHRGRIPRFLIIHSLLRMPFLSNFLTKLGGVIASQDNAARLFEAENLVGIFPEGIRGAFTPYRDTYRLRDFSKSGFAKVAIENQAPIVPAAVVGHSEIFPIIGRIDSSYLTRTWGWPYLPIAPMFPIAPVPLPSKWHVRVLRAVGLEGLRPSDAANARLVREFSLHIQNLLQSNIDEMLTRRKRVFWGSIFDSAPLAKSKSGGA
jgi:1-acyl-sn-glycerol-3-phosphate acyltransferase